MPQKHPPANTARSVVALILCSFFHRTTRDDYQKGEFDWDGRSGDSRGMRSILWLLTVSLAASAQDLKVSAVHASPGDEIRVDISIESPAGKGPSTLKWETVFPAQLMDPVGDAPELGKAAKDTDKAIACAKSKPYSITCILYGGLKRLDNGVIATVRFKVHKDARVGETKVTVQKAEGVAGDLKQFDLKVAEGSIDIR